MANNPPTVGRIVHYHGAKIGMDESALYPRPRAAIVTRIGNCSDWMVDLCVFDQNGLYFLQDVEHAPGDKPEPTCWTWPPRG